VGEFELHAHRFEDQQDVGKDDRGVYAQPLGRSDRNFGRQRRIFAELEESGFGADGPVFGLVAARLPNIPVWGLRLRLAATRPHKHTVLQCLSQRRPIIYQKLTLNFPPRAHVQL
jgi:hypothetical protein